MKVVFLDVDGVLNNFSLIRDNGFDYIDPTMVGRMKLVISQTNANIVLSSYWRLDRRDRGLVDAALASKGMAIRDVTPKLFGTRASEISTWIRANPSVRRFAIIDDDEEAGIGMSDSFFWTDPEVGLTLDIVDRVVSHLNEV